MAATTPITHIAILSSPGMGHLIPILELAKRLVFHHHFAVTVFVASPNPIAAPPSDSTLLNVVHLPATSASDATILQQLSSMVRSVFHLLRSAISQSHPSVLIVDLFGTEAFEIADEFSMKKFVFCTSNAWYLAENLYVPALNKEILPDQELRIPGCNPIRYEDLAEAVRAWGEPDYAEFVRMGSAMARSDGILVNSWEDLDPTTIAALRTNPILNHFINGTPVHLIGPLTRPVQSTGLGENIDRTGLLAWLDAQPMESVLYVSFGSGGTLSARQTAELAWGLEQSQQRFVWVIRPPLDGDSAGSLFGSKDGSDEISRFVPDGFEDRIRGAGRLVPMWAPQSEILAHHAVGGFLTHCGWNSALESLSNGVPMIAWPLYAEQSMNATLMCEEVKVAVRPRESPSKEVVGRGEIERMVREVMEGQIGRGLRERAKEVKASADKVLSRGGSSWNSLEEVAREFELHDLTLKR